MLVFARLKNGNEIQIEVLGDQTKIIQFIEDYKGDDLGNDLILQDFVTDFKETGVEILND
ncbi:hypothetical protein [Elizabethkingia phage TCUEAP2]|nr:hypothetical protein [Elizabethkingia phage TCUEAP2]